MTMRAQPNSCPCCGQAPTLHLDMVCSRKNKWLFRFGPVQVVLAILFCVLVGAAVAMSLQTYAEAAIVAALIFYVAAILRNDDGLGRALVPLVATCGYLLLETFATHGLALPGLRVAKIDVDPALLAFLLLVTYLLFQLVASWWNACSALGVGLVVGVPALSTALLIVGLALRMAVGDALPAPLSIAPYFSGYLQIRFLTMDLVVVFVLMIALVRTIEIGVEGPAPVFATAEVTPPQPPESEPADSIAGALADLARFVAYSAVVFACHAMTFVRGAINVVWHAVVLLGKYLQAFMGQIWKVVQTEVELLFNLFVRFVRWHVLPWAVAYTMAATLGAWVQRFSLYLLTGGAAWSDVGAIVGLFVVLLAFIVVLVFLASGVSFSKVFLSVGKSHTLLSFILLAVAVASSFILFGASRIAPVLAPFYSFGTLAVMAWMTLLLATVFGVLRASSVSAGHGSSK